MIFEAFSGSKFWILEKTILVASYESMEKRKSFLKKKNHLAQVLKKKNQFYRERGRERERRK